jgi:hypothetical protein
MLGADAECPDWGDRKGPVWVGSGLSPEGEKRTLPDEPPEQRAQGNERRTDPIEDDCPKEMIPLGLIGAVLASGPSILSKYPRRTFPLAFRGSRCGVSPLCFFH